MCCIINRPATPTNTSSAIRQFGSRFTSGSRSVAATYTVTPPDSGRAYFNCPCSALVSRTPNSVAAPNNPAPRIALRFPRPLASATDAMVNPSGNLCRNTATKSTTPSHVEIRNPAAIATPIPESRPQTPPPTCIRRPRPENIPGNASASPCGPQSTRPTNSPPPPPPPAAPPTPSEMRCRVPSSTVPEQNHIPFLHDVVFPFQFDV